MKKEIKFNTTSIIMLNTIIGMLITDGVFNQRHEEPLYRSETLKKCKDVKNEYLKIKDDNDFIIMVNISYIKYFFKNLNKNLKRLEKLPLHWSSQEYVNFVKNEFQNLLLDFKEKSK